MIQVSDAWKEHVKNSSRYGIKIDVTFKNGTTKQLTESDLMIDGINWQEDLMGIGDFKFGSLVTNSFSIRLNNMDDRFESVDFTDAKLIPYVGVGDEWYQRGEYYVKGHKMSGAIVELTGYDILNKLDDSLDKFSPGQYHQGFTTGESFATVIERTLTDYGIPIDPRNIGADGHIKFYGSTNAVQMDSDGKDMSARDLISSLLEICGLFAKITRLGKLYIFAITEIELTNAPIVSKIVKPPLIAFKKYIITGILVSCYQGSNISYDEEELVYAESELYYATTGENGGIYYVNDNAFVISEGIAEWVCEQMLAPVAIGINIYPFSLTAMADPTIEIGDLIKIPDGDSYRVSLLTSYSMNLCGTCTMSFDADQYGEETFAEVIRLIRR